MTENETITAHWAAFRNVQECRPCARPRRIAASSGDLEAGAALQASCNVYGVYCSILPRGLSPADWRRGACAGSRPGGA
eukprot:13929640-Heterocapsa_arctica.AAC.2